MEKQNTKIWLGSYVTFPPRYLTSESTKDLTRFQDFAVTYMITALF
jgi:hypothetical protein